MSLQRFHSTPSRVRVQLQSLDDIDKLSICHVQRIAPTSAPQRQCDHAEEPTARVLASNKENAPSAVRLRKNPKPLRSPSKSDVVDDAAIFKLPSHPASATAFMPYSRNGPLPTPPRSCEPDSVFLDTSTPEPTLVSEPTKISEPMQVLEHMSTSRPVRAPQSREELPTPPDSPFASSFTNLGPPASRGSFIQFPQLLREFQIQRDRRWSESASPSPVSTPTRRQGQSSSPELQRKSNRVIERDRQARKRCLSSSSSSSFDESDTSSSNPSARGTKPRRCSAQSPRKPRMLKLTKPIDNYEAIEEAAFWPPRRRTRNDFRSSGLNISEDEHVSKVWSLSSAEHQVLASQVEIIDAQARPQSHPQGVVVGTQVTLNDLELSIQKCNEAEIKLRDTLEHRTHAVIAVPKPLTKKPAASVPAAHSASSFTHKVCGSCGCRDTPCWRPGWEANMILCNSCGLR